jgi:hypothetical protein
MTASKIKCEALTIEFSNTRRQENRRRINRSKFQRTRKREKLKHTGKTLKRMK